MAVSVLKCFSKYNDKFIVLKNTFCKPNGRKERKKIKTLINSSKQ